MEAYARTRVGAATELALALGLEIYGHAGALFSAVDPQGEDSPVVWIKTETTEEGYKARQTTLEEEAKLGGSVGRREEYRRTETAVTREEAQEAWDRLGEIDKYHWVIWNGELSTDPRYREERERCYRIVEAYIFLRPHPYKEAS